MALIDDIEFYGSRVDAGDIDRAQAAQLLAQASGGGLTVLGAEQAIDTWKGQRARGEQMLADVVDTLRALDNGRPVPEHVRQNMRSRAREDCLRMIRRISREDS
ncbi:hypothetical protein [Streptomyces sp. NPDC058297]|uniref:hypothetical protein n=1 Tax=Streptomyces sp. NPDC058297 TaxID=3346433 RepID=UPI0036E7EE06